MKKIRCVMLLVLIAIIANIVMPIGYVKAATTQNIQIKNRGTMSFFRYEGELINQRYLMHEQDGKYHPVYRICAETENSPESIMAQVGNEVIEKKLYQIVKGGFPYYSAEQLGCSSDFYAYVATQTAIDCYIRGYELENLEPVSQEAEKMKQAIEKIYQNAQAVFLKDKLSIEVQAIEDWKLIDNKEVRRDFEVTCNQDEALYTVKTSDETVHIRNAQNEEKSSFSSAEVLRLVLTKEELYQDRNWETTVRVEANIKDIYQTQNTDNGRTYLLCDYQFTQEKEVSFQQMLVAYKEETTEKSEQESEEKPAEEVEENTIDNTEETKETEETEENSQIINILPKTGY